MPPAAYALASDTLIGVVRASAAGLGQVGGGPAGPAEASLLAPLRGLALWLLRLSLAPRSTAAGFRLWVIEECPVAPGRTAVRAARLPAPALPPSGTPRPAGPGRPGDDLPGARTDGGDCAPDPCPVQPAGAPPAGPGTPPAPPRPTSRARRGQTKTARFLALVTEQHGPLTAIPLGSVARICAASAPQVGLNPGSARTALRRAVLAAQARPDTPAEQAPPKGDQS
jgi:hypothetical protein